MKINNIMKYLESEYSIINKTPCKICGGEYFVNNLEIDIIKDITYDVCTCICEDCGYEKTFKFYAPFLNKKTSKKYQKNMN